MNINIWNIYFELRMKDQIEKRFSHLVPNLTSCEKKAWKKNHVWTGFELMTSAMPVHQFRVFLILKNTFVSHGRQPEVEYFLFWRVFTPHNGRVKLLLAAVAWRYKRDSVKTFQKGKKCDFRLPSVAQRRLFNYYYLRGKWHIGHVWRLPWDMCDALVLRC